MVDAHSPSPKNGSPITTAAQGFDAPLYGCHPADVDGPDEARLADIVQGVLGSYAAHGNINHLDGHNLPARDEVADVLDSLLKLLFPGFFGNENLDALTASYVVGERCARCMRCLERLVFRALQQRQGDPDAAPSRRALEQESRDLAFDLLAAIPDIREVLDVDVQAALAGDPAATSSQEVISSYPGVMATAVHRIAHHLYKRRVPLIPRIMSEIIHGRTGIDIHPGARIGSGFFIDHGTGVVIGETTVIGRDVKLYQGVTLGALSVDGVAVERGQYDLTQKRHPTLEDRVTVYAGATILGGDTVVGAGSTVGGNVWLTHSVPANTTVMLDKPSLRFRQPKVDGLATAPSRSSKIGGT